VGCLRQPGQARSTVAPTYRCMQTQRMHDTCRPPGLHFSVVRALCSLCLAASMPGRRTARQVGRTLSRPLSRSYLTWVRCACSSHGPHHLQLNGEQHLLPTNCCIRANTQGTARQQQADGTVPCLNMQCLNAPPSAHQSPVRCQVTLLLSKMSWRAPGIPRHASANTALAPRQGRQ